MRRILTLITAILIFGTGAHAIAQEKKPSGESRTPAATESKQHETEVDKLISKAKERGETVLIRCLQDCGENAIEGDVENGHALELPTPRYPAIARAAHASGEVTVQVLIGVDGKVIEAVAISGHPLLYGVSVEAARNARFTPTMLAGAPVKVTGVILYKFVSQ